MKSTDLGSCNPLIDQLAVRISTLSLIYELLGKIWRELVPVSQGACGMKGVVSADAIMHTLQLGDTQKAAKDLLALVDMINQAVGDALSGILLVEAALRRRKWGLDEWATLYTDLPSRQLKVVI